LQRAAELSNLTKEQHEKNLIINRVVFREIEKETKEAFDFLNNAPGEVPITELISEIDPADEQAYNDFGSIVQKSLEIFNLAESDVEVKLHHIGKAVSKYLGNLFHK